MTPDGPTPRGVHPAATEMLDAVVVGAGPAGCAAAIELARAGCSVVVVDKARFPRDKCCGDGLTTGALRHLDQLGLDPGSVESWQAAADVVVRSPSGRSFTLPMPRDGATYAAVARRRDLDAALVALARGSGARVLEGAALDAVEVHDDHVNVHAGDDAPLQARYVVGADGIYSPLRKALGLASPGYRGDAHALRQYLSGVGPAATRDVFIWFDYDLLPGYLWSFPLPGGRANVGFGVHRRHGPPVGEAGALWPELLARPHVRAVLGEAARPEGPVRAWPLPARLDRVPLTGPRTLFVGDAAAATDPLTGEGIGQALETGRLAASAVSTEGHRGPEAVAAAYRSSVARHLLADHRLARSLAHALERPRTARGALRAAGATAWTRRQVARWLFEDYPRALVMTPGRWHRGALHAVGAFSRPNGPERVA